MKTYFLAVFIVLCELVGCGCPRSNRASIYVPPPEVADLVAHIDYAPYKAHANLTPAVDQLVDIGEPALPFVIDLMLSDDEWTRMHTASVLYGVLSELYGWKSGQGWTRPGGEAACRALWVRLGSISSEGTKEQRVRAVKLWKEWIASRAVERGKNG